MLLWMKSCGGHLLAYTATHPSLSLQEEKRREEERREGKRREEKRREEKRRGEKRREEMTIIKEYDTVQCESSVHAVLWSVAQR